MTRGLAVLRRPATIVFAAGVVVIVVIAVLAKTVTGHAAPARHQQSPLARPFALQELGDPGHRVSLAAFAGQPVIVNFFASWCGPCKKETPLLAKFYAAQHGRVHVIGIDSNDQTAAALAFVKAQDVGYPVGVDPFPAPTATSYGVLALPQTFFLNSAHRIVRHVAGGLTAAELSAWAAQLNSSHGTG
jgi:thiol-disulfide isomerase/thioredoxin